MGLLEGRVSSISIDLRSETDFQATACCQILIGRSAIYFHGSFAQMREFADELNREIGRRELAEIEKKEVANVGPDSI